MTETTDAVLRGAVKQWIAELPDAERDALIAEIREPSTEPTTAADGKGLARGRAAYRDGSLTKTR